MNLLLKFKQKYIILLLIIFFIVNLLFLSSFPFIHSDEAWLSGLSRTYLETGAMNYTFFDIYPTAHHTMKMVFILIQSAFIKILGYSIFSVRLISLFFSTCSLYIFYKILKHYTDDIFVILLTTILLSFNLQFILISHIARQEAPLIFLFLLAYYIILKNYKHNNILLASILGIGIGIHPNIFFLALSLGLIYIFKIINKEKKIIDLVKLITFTIGYFAIYIFTTFNINGNFFPEYNSYGETLGVANGIINKIQGFYYFYYKLFHEISGTYFLVDLKFDYLLLIITGSLYIYLVKKKKIDLNASYSQLFLIAINIGILILGRYNQISVIFPIVFLYLSFAIFIIKLNFNKNYIYSFLILLVLFQTYNSIDFIKNTQNENYKSYLNEFSIIPDDANILANLNLEYKFKDKLFDYRNLYYLKDNDLTIKEYIKNNNIKYIVWYEEMDYYYRNAPKWDIIYGELYYYNDMKDFLINNCEIEKEFENKTYAMRIAKYVNTYPWKITIYKVKANIK